MARPTKLTPRVAAKITHALEAGAYPETAAALAGISKDSFYRWLKRGGRERTRLDENPGAIADPDEALYLRFSDSIESAIAHGQMHDLNLIAAAAQPRYEPIVDANGQAVTDEDGVPFLRCVYGGQWQAAAWRLERRFPDQYARRTKTELTGHEGGPIEIDAATAARERLASYLSGVAARAGEGELSREPE